MDGDDEKKTTNELGDIPNIWMPGDIRAGFSDGDATPLIPPACQTYPPDLEAWRKRLQQAEKVPDHLIDEIFSHVKRHLHQLGLDQPSAGLIAQWIGELLHQRGIRAETLVQEMLNVSLRHVESHIKKPSTPSARGTQNPETTSHHIARQLKRQFACRRVFHRDVVEAHEVGDLSLIHLGDVDRPHDVFLTPDYIKAHGLPASQWAPESGPPRHLNVLMAQMVRFTRELQRNFSGDIHWGFVNTLLLPFTEAMPDSDLAQFIQQLVFEFSQIDPTPGQDGQRVVLDMDLDMPRYFEAASAMGPGGGILQRSIDSYTNELHRFNEILLDVLDRGDFKKSPFHAPRLVFHLNRVEDPWTGLHQHLFSMAMASGNPGVSLSFKDRDFGAFGRLQLNHPDVMRYLTQPASLRGFSTNSVALNLPRLLMKRGKAEFTRCLSDLLSLALNAHRQKRIFLSRLMASGAAGPLRFLRHRHNGRPFLRLDSATQPIHLIGLGEAARLATGSPNAPAEARIRQAQEMGHIIRGEIQSLNQRHKLRLMLSDAPDESVSCRLADLDLRTFGQSHSNYILQHLSQTDPIYTSGSNILVFDDIDWRHRFSLEGRLHDSLQGCFELTLFSAYPAQVNPGIYQRMYRQAVDSGIRSVRFAPDLKLCRSCHLVFHDIQAEATCPNCSGCDTTDYGYGVSGFSPVDIWCRGMRAAWRLRHRWDQPADQTQTPLPI